MNAHITTQAEDAAMSDDAPQMRRVDVSVTEGYIAAGQPWQACACPIALALRDALGWPQVWVSPALARFGEGVRPAPDRGFALPSIVVRRAMDFDLGKGMQPFRFAVEVPK